MKNAALLAADISSLMDVISVLVEKYEDEHVSDVDEIISALGL